MIPSMCKQLTDDKNFFSTSFVDNDSPTGSPKKLVVLSNWWIFVVVSVPLTIVTLYIWWVFTDHQASGTYPRWWKIASVRLSRGQKKTVAADEESNIGPVSAATTMKIDSDKA